MGKISQRGGQPFWHVVKIIQKAKRENKKKTATQKFGVGGESGQKRTEEIICMGNGESMRKGKRSHIYGQNNGVKKWPVGKFWRIYGFVLGLVILKGFNGREL